MGVLLVLITFLCRYLIPALLIKLNLGLKDILSSILFIVFAFLAMSWDSGHSLQQLSRLLEACYLVDDACSELYLSLVIGNADSIRTCNAENFFLYDWSHEVDVQVDKALILKNLFIGLNTGLKCLVPLVVVDLIFAILMTFGGLKMANPRHLTMVAKVALLSLAAKQLM